MSLDKGSLVLWNNCYQWISWGFFLKKCVFTLLYFIYLVALGLSFSMEIFLSLLQNVESLVATHGIQFPDQGLNPGPRHWECRVLATGPPGKSLTGILKFNNKTPWIVKGQMEKHNLSCIIVGLYMAFLLFVHIFDFSLKNAGLFQIFFSSHILDGQKKAAW